MIDECKRICGILIFDDYILEDEFINKIKQNKLGMWGSYEVRTSGQAYYVDYKQEKTVSKRVKTACGKTRTVNVITCGGSVDAQVPTIYKDVLDENINKVLNLHISYEEFRKVACNKDVFDALVNLIKSKVDQSTRDLIYNTVLCGLNDPENYKKIETLEYCSCNGCDGLSLLGAINLKTLNIQRDNSQYVLADREYHIPSSNQ